MKKIIIVIVAVIIVIIGGGVYIILNQRSIYEAFPDTSTYSTANIPTPNIEEITQEIRDKCAQGGTEATWVSGLESTPVYKRIHDVAAQIKVECGDCMVAYDSTQDIFIAPPYEYTAENGALVKKLGTRVTWPGYTFLFVAEPFDIRGLGEGTVSEIVSVDGETTLLPVERSATDKAGLTEAFIWRAKSAEHITADDGSWLLVSKSFFTSEHNDGQPYLVRREGDETVVYSWDTNGLDSYDTNELDQYFMERTAALQSLQYQDKIENQLYDLYIRLGALTPEDPVSDIYKADVLELTMGQKARYGSGQKLDSISYHGSLAAAYIAPESFWTVSYGFNGEISSEYAFTGAEYLSNDCGNWEACPLPANSLAADKYLEIVKNECGSDN